VFRRNMEVVEEIRGNKAVEDEAIAWVMGLERRAGRDPRDTRHDAQNPADLISPPRVIEVKAFGASARGNDLSLETNQVDEARGNPNFFLYVVEDVRQGDPDRFTLKVLGGTRLRRLLDRAKEQRYFSVPWPVADYESSPSTIDTKESPRTPSSEVE
jgi:hypothetical protein